MILKKRCLNQRVHVSSVDQIPTRRDVARLFEHIERKTYAGEHGGVFEMHIREPFAYREVFGHIVKENEETRYHFERAPAE